MAGHGYSGKKNKLPNAFTVSQLQKIYEVMFRPKLAIAAFLAFFCGLRIEEVCRLRLRDIDLENRKLKVIDSKNPNRTAMSYGKDRYVPIPKKVISPLKKWLEIIGSSSEWLLPSMNSPDRPIRKKSLYEQFKETLQQANLLLPAFQYTEKKGPNKGKVKTKHLYYFHTLRHSYATYLLGKGVDIYTISDLMGHNQVSTTQIYARINPTQQKKAVEDAFDGPLKEFESTQNQHQMFRQVVTPAPMDESLERLRLEVERNKIELEKMKLMREQVLIQTV